VIFSAMLIPILPEVACISKSCLRILENMNEKTNYKGYIYEAIGIS